jgi:hypothetical protein
MTAGQAPEAARLELTEGDRQAAREAYNACDPVDWQTSRLDAALDAAVERLAHRLREPGSEARAEAAARLQAGTDEWAVRVLRACVADGGELADAYAQFCATAVRGWVNVPGDNVPGDRDAWERQMRALVRAEGLLRAEAEAAAP